MKRERLLRLCGVILLCIAAVASVVLLRAGQAEWLLRALRATYCVPTAPLQAFGPFHFAWLGGCICAAVLAGVLGWRTCSETVTDRVVFGAGVVFFLLEWYKQLFSFYVLGSGTYDFTVFPFQFCSLPIYVCLPAPLLGRRAKHTLYAFLALFGTVGGYLVMAYPNLPASTTMCVHTMLWHSGMIALGVYLLVAERCGRSFRRDYLPAAGVFLASFAAATGWNLLLEPLSGSTVNLFYMSPYRKTYFLVVREVQRLWGWGASAAAYILLFLLVGALPLWFLGVILCRVRKKGRKN